MSDATDKCSKCDEPLYRTEFSVVHCPTCMPDPRDALRRAEAAEAEVARLGKALDDAHVRNATDQDEHAAQRAALAAEVERLTRERDEARARFDVAHRQGEELIAQVYARRVERDAAVAALAASEAREAALREAFDTHETNHHRDPFAQCRACSSDPSSRVAVLLAAVEVARAGIALRDAETTWADAMAVSVSAADSASVIADAAEFTYVTALDAFAALDAAQEKKP